MSDKRPLRKYALNEYNDRVLSRLRWDDAQLKNLDRLNIIVSDLGTRMFKVGPSKRSQVLRKIEFGVDPTPDQVFNAYCSAGLVKNHPKPVNLRRPRDGQVAARAKRPPPKTALAG